MAAGLAGISTTVFLCLFGAPVVIGGKNSLDALVKRNTLPVVTSTIGPSSNPGLANFGSRSWPRSTRRNTITWVETVAAGCRVHAIDMSVVAGHENFVNAIDIYGAGEWPKRFSLEGQKCPTGHHFRGGSQKDGSKFVKKTGVVSDKKRVRPIDVERRRERISWVGVPVGRGKIWSFACRARSAPYTPRPQALREPRACRYWPSTLELPASLPGTGDASL